jgi:hypothetical protein
MQEDQIEEHPTVLLKARQVLGSVGIASGTVSNVLLYSGRSGTLMDCDTVSLYPERYYGSNIRVEGMDRCRRNLLP